MKLAVIPAHGGSKDFPCKNIKRFCGRPMIVGSIGSAQQSGWLERIVVSTDAADIDNIADVAWASGTEALFFRPAKLADGHTGTVPATVNAIGWMSRSVGPVHLPPASTPPRPSSGRKTRDAAPVLLPRHRVQGFDTEEDWECAGFMSKIFDPSQGRQL